MSSRRIYRSGIDDLTLLSENELKNCNLFCLKCKSSSIYVRIKTDDYVCRRCGNVSTRGDFAKEIDNIIQERRKILQETIERIGHTTSNVC